MRTLLAALGLLLVALPAVAQDNKAVQIRWFGHSYFLLVTTAGTKVAFDPHSISEYGAPQIAPDIVLISHPHNDHNRKEILANADSKSLRAFEGVLPKGRLGEWNKIDEKVKDIRVRSVGTFHDEEEGAKRGRNAVFVVEADGLVICHLGDLGHELSEEQAKAIGTVDVLMIPIGGIYTLNGEAAKKVVAQLKPRLYILPMHYGTKVYQDLPGPDEFLDGQKEVRDLADKTNLLEIPKDFKSDRPTVVMLGWK